MEEISRDKPWERRKIFCLSEGKKFSDLPQAKLKGNEKVLDNDLPPLLGWHAVR